MARRLLLLLFSAQLSTSQLSSPCSYPHYINKAECALQEDTTLLQGWACDPENTISMAELHILNEYIKDIYRTNANTCQCPKSESPHCGYKFGFAFVKNISQDVYPALEHVTKSFCPHKLPLSPRKRNFTLPKEVLNYMQNYARIVRERWNLGTCGEDILILIVNDPPEQLIPHSFNTQRHMHPLMVVSYGKLITEKFGESLDDHLSMDSLFRIVDEENMNLQNGYPLIKVLNNVVRRSTEAFNLADYKLQIPHSKHHIPLWAWIIFASCGVLFILMAVGLCLVKSTSRRGTLRSKSHAMDPARRWKAGFVGEENQPVTYVNLVQMMMPHQRNQPPIQQQVTI